MCFLEGFMAGVIAFGCILRLAEIVTKLIKRRAGCDTEDERFT